ncbi:MAG: hypothetical protein ABI903_10060 [Actinomycetota bacterium]
MSSPASKEAAVRILAGLSEEQRVGQLIMVGAEATGFSNSTFRALSDCQVGNAILNGRSNLGVTATSDVSA